MQENRNVEAVDEKKAKVEPVEWVSSNTNENGSWRTTASERDVCKMFCSISAKRADMHQIFSNPQTFTSF